MSLLITCPSNYLNWSFDFWLLQFVYVIKSMENAKTFTNFITQHFQTDVAMWLVYFKNIINKCNQSFLIDDPSICKDYVVKFIEYASSM